MSEATETNGKASKRNGHAHANGNARTQAILEAVLAEQRQTNVLLARIVDTLERSEQHDKASATALALLQRSGAINMQLLDAIAQNTRATHDK